MASKIRAKRKRGKGNDVVASTSKRSKTVKWEWLGDGGKWNQYSDKSSQDLTEAFVAGKEDVVVGVAPRVKMRARFNAMTQSNVSTGWQRDLRCVEDTPNYKPPIWKWEESGEWERFPDNASRQLEAAYLCGLEEVGVSVALKQYSIDLIANEMKEDSGKVRNVKRIELEKTDRDHVWEWEDENGQWNGYSDDHAHLLEEGFISKARSVNFSVQGHSYTVNIKKMEQINDATNVGRSVRRRLLATKPSDNGTETTNMECQQSLEELAEDKVKKKVSKGSKQVKDESSCSKASVEDNLVKSQLFTGKCPVDSECKPKLGKAHVFVEGEDVWNSTLNQTNLKNNNNKFYIIQLLEDNGRKSYSVWFRWGRVGKPGQNQLQAFGGDLESAKNTFRKKFYDKTQNTWEERGSFVKVGGKYDLLEMDYEAEEETDVGQDEMEVEEKKKPDSKLDKRLQSLIELICNIQAMEDAVKEMKYDTKKAPLGKLTSSQIKNGYLALKKIENLISANKASSDQLIRACDEFYTRIPHDFGMRRPPLINTKQMVKEKLALLEALGDIQIALKVIQGGDKTEDEHPIDRQYKELHCELKPLDRSDEAVGLIEKYVKQTHGRTHTDYSLSVTDVFEMKKEGEQEQFKDVGNRQLLWHGSRLTNWVGIINKGLRIAPPEAPVTGYMFGKGVYFADVSSKSANYCFATPTKNEGVCILCEVSLGSPNELLAADYNANNLPSGKDSVKGLGRMGPDPAHNHTLPDGCVIPLGPICDLGIRNPSGYTLNYNEFIVYDTCQIKMKYLVRLKFNFK